MADKKDEEETEKEEGAEEGQENPEAQAEESKKKKKKKIIIIAAAAVVLLGAVGGGVYFSGILKPNKTEVLNKKAKKKHKEEEGGSSHGSSGSSAKAVKQNLGEWVPGPVPGHEGDDVQYYNLPEFLVNLNTGGKQTSFIKMEVTLEVPTEGDNDAIDSRMPRITDSFNTYLRELRAGDIAGSAGLYRLREELLLRINKIIYPNKVNDVLFREIIIQ